MTGFEQAVILMLGFLFVVHVILIISAINRIFSQESEELSDDEHEEIIKIIKKRYNVKIEEEKES